ncbi:DUF4139 domain-containing protein [Azovibrio restrictus]|uniref:DUF4139 domain-containing protein n=1 Tax=Azovibrio restrictus TaxID=146938 RepID=UPI0026EEFB3F|nr:DUF4139 domain-containing protein [Azovibrio restrictus]MDD3484847.1 DUF4139 domain-containing protein [Azovibrio restrictus]
MMPVLPNRASLFLLTLLCWGSAQAGQTAPVSRVVLYPGSALVERVAQVRAGQTQLEIDGLPASFDVDSVQIEADAGIEIGEQAWRDRARSAPLNAEEARLEKLVRGLEENLNSLDVERKAAARALKYLDALATPNDNIHSGNPARTLETIRQGSLQAQRRILDIDNRKIDLTRELEARRQDLERVRPGVNSVRQLQLRLQAHQDGRLRIRYLFADAGWRPAYRAMLDSDRKRVELERMAQIAQRSGEDWSQVSLTLSTGQPRQQVAGPLPYTWELSLEAEKPEADKLLERAEPMAAAAKPARPAAPAREREPLFQVAVNQSEFATEYVIPGKLSLPADGGKINVSLGRLQLPVELQARIAPRQEKAAYLIAQGELPEGVWPAGEMQFYRDGAYVGRDTWDPAEDTELELSFGRDERIKVATRQLAADQASAGFVGQQTERRIADLFTITNQHRRPMDILVLDASPVARDSEIQVEARFKPPVSQQDWQGRQGVVAWEQELKAGAAQEFSADYRVRWPREQEILGLD